MKSIAWIVLLLSVLMLPARGDDAAPRIHYEQNGFSILPLEGASEEGVYQVLHMYLPVSDGFAPNVNVQIQRFGESLDEYARLSEYQFEQMGLEVLDHVRTDTDRLGWEYRGEMSGRSLHFYSVAEQRDGQIFLVTATATRAQWPEYQSRLRETVDSFRMEHD